MAKLQSVRKWARDNNFKVEEDENVIYVYTNQGHIFWIAEQESTCFDGAWGSEGQAKGYDLKCKMKGENICDLSERYKTQKEVIFVMDNRIN